MIDALYANVQITSFYSKTMTDEFAGKSEKSFFCVESVSSVQNKNNETDDKMSTKEDKFYVSGGRIRKVEL